MSSCMHKRVQNNHEMMHARECQCTCKVDQHLPDHEQSLLHARDANTHAHDISTWANRETNEWQLMYLHITAQQVPHPTSMVTPKKKHTIQYFFSCTSMFGSAQLSSDKNEHVTEFVRIWRTRTSKQTLRGTKTCFNLGSAFCAICALASLKRWYFSTPPQKQRIPTQHRTCSEHNEQQTFRRI